MLPKNVLSTRGGRLAAFSLLYLTEGIPFGFSAIALTAGASADADYDKGVAVFTMGQGGVMVDASVGGQNFTYESLAVAGDS